MKRKLTELDITNTDTQFDSNFGKTSSALTAMPSTQGSGFRLDSPKVFQRKPTFKIFQRREKKENDAQNKICYISPQKSDLFKKYGSFRSNGSNVNTSVFTNNSSELFWNEQNRKSSNKTNLELNLNESRSIFTELNNMRGQDGFRTPKNAKTDSNFLSQSNLRKVSINNLKSDGFGSSQNSNLNTDREFDSLNQIHDIEVPSEKHSRMSYLQTQRRSSIYSQNGQKQNYFPEVSSQRVSFGSNIKHYEQEIQRLKAQSKKLTSMKNQLQDSSRLFLEEIKELQLKLQNSQKQKSQKENQIIELREKLTQKNNRISNLSSRIKEFEATKQTFEYKTSELEMNEQYKVLYFQLSQKLKYLSVENNILKKMLEEKKQDNFKIQKLQTLNKKLNAKNKYLNRELEELEKQASETKKQQTKKITFPLHLHKPTFAQRSTLPHEKFNSIPSKRSTSAVIVGNGLNDSINELQAISKDLQGIQNTERFSIASNSSSLQLSFELSPQKNYKNFKFSDDIGTQDVSKISDFYG